MKQREGMEDREQQKQLKEVAKETLADYVQHGAITEEARTMLLELLEK